MSWISERAEMARKIFWRSWVKVFLGAWSVLAIYDLLVSQIVPTFLADRAPKLRDVLAETGGWLPVQIWLLVLAAVLIVQLFEFAVSEHSKHQKVTIVPGKPVSSFSDSIPDVRFSDYQACDRLFDGSERDKLLPLLEAGKIDAWGRAGNGFPPLTKISPDLWRTHYLEHYPADSSGRINQTFLKVKAGPFESRYYDVHLNRAELERVWPSLWEPIPLIEAATRAYEQTKEHEVSILPVGLAGSTDDILTWYCRAMMISEHGKAPLVRLMGNEPPSRLIEEIDVPLYNRFDFEVVGNAIVLERHGSSRFENLTVEATDLANAIKAMKGWKT
jgi:hypothetical protein